jgi:hypothetical protein
MGPTGKISHYPAPLRSGLEYFRANSLSSESLHNGLKGHRFESLNNIGGRRIIDKDELSAGSPLWIRANLAPCSLFAAVKFQSDGFISKAALLHNSFSVSSADVEALIREVGGPENTVFFCAGSSQRSSLETLFFNAKRVLIGLNEAGLSYTIDQENFQPVIKNERGAVISDLGLGIIGDRQYPKLARSVFFGILPNEALLASVRLVDHSEFLNMKVITRDQGLIDL